MADVLSEDNISLRILNFGDFVNLDVPVREMVMAPVLPVQGLAMVYAPRGLGKTFFALGLAHAVAGGGPFLRWNAPQPRRVLYVDGKMPAALMKERTNLVIRGTGYAVLNLDNLRILSADLQGDVQLDVSTVEGQELINRHISDVEVVVLDNLASLHLVGGESEGDSWLQMQAWLLQLRRCGKSVLIVHHSGKGGQQRGTSRREDVLDTVMALRRPSDYSPAQGARFEVHLEKARGLHGPDTDPFEAQLQNTPSGGVRWTTESMHDVNRLKVISTAEGGLTVAEIATETGLSRSVVGRIRKAAVDAGELDNAWKEGAAGSERQGPTKVI